MRKKDDELREVLLSCAREIAGDGGVEAVNIRALAQKAGIAAGTVYNYFAGKEEILLALTEECWKKALQEMCETVSAKPFCCQLEEMYLFLKMRMEDSAGTLMRSLENVQDAGRIRMHTVQMEFASVIIGYMEQDRGIRTDIWKEGFTREKFADFIVRNLTMLLRTENADIRFLTELVKKIIY